jgi:hypothetical protein
MVRWLSAILTVVPPSIANEQYHDPRHERDPAAHRPSKLSGHKAARQYVDSTAPPMVQDTSEPKCKVKSVSIRILKHLLYKSN